MATIVAQATGNWSATGTWTGGSVPGAGDTAQTGAYVVTIDQDITVTTIEATDSGYFAVTAAHTITANVVSNTSASNGALQCTHTSGTVTINGNITAGAKAGLHSSGSNGHVSIVGDVTGGSDTNARGVMMAVTADLSVTGNLIAAAGAAVHIQAGANAVIVGNVTGGSTSNGIGFNKNGSIGTTTITGTVTGGTNTSGHGVNNVSTATLTIIGTVIGGSHALAYGANNASTGTINVTRAKGSASTLAPGLYGANSGGSSAFKEIEFGANGSPPVGGYTKLTVDQTTNRAIVKRADTGADLTLAWDYPAVADVEDGVVYWLGTLEGTLEAVVCDYPAEADVRLGVDYNSAANTGTLDLPAVTDVQDGVTFDGATKTGTFAAPAVGDVQEGVGYGASGTEYTGTFAVPAETDVEEGVGYGAGGTEYTGELVVGADWTDDEKNQIRKALGITGTTAATSGTGNLDTVLATTNDLATDEEIADSVRTELTVELAHLDADVSSRLAAVDYTEPPAADVVADAVRTELATELAHLDADVSDAGLTAQETRDAMKLAPTAGDPAAGSVDDYLDTIMTSPSGLTAQETRDAMKLAASAGAAAAGSIDAKLDTIDANVDAIKLTTDALDVTAVTHVAASNAGEITIKPTLTLAAVVSGLTIPADWTACYWTVKRSTDEPDADAIVQVLVSNPPDADDGIQVLAGEAVEDGSDGSLVVNQAGGTVTIALDADSTAALEDAVELVWDVKVHAPGAKTQAGAGTATITTAVTRT